MKHNRKATRLLLLLVMYITLITPTTAQAAEKKKVTIKTIKSGTTMSVGTSKSLNVKVNTKSSLSYKSSNSKIVAVKKGKLTAKKPGSTKIAVTATPKSKKYKKTSKAITIKVTPQKPSAPSLKRSGKTITASVKKVKYASGYQYQYATNKKMSGAKSTVTKSTTYKFNASAYKDYYVRVRAYTKTGGKTYYSAWSTIKSAPKTTASAKPTTPAPSNPSTSKPKPEQPTPSKPTPSKPIPQPETPAPTPSKPTSPSTCSHTWDSGTITKQPTCSTAGVKTYTCTKCKTTKTESIPANEQHAWEVLYYDAPTCERPSFKSYYCPYCGETKCEYPEPATGHKWVEYPEEGHYETRIEYISAQVCNTCGKGYTEYRLLNKYNLTEREVLAAGYEIVEGDAASAAGNHVGDSKECMSYELEKVPILAFEHEKVYVIDKPSYSECSVCGTKK